MTSPAKFDPSSLVGVLLTQAVEFVMIGGYAAEVQGVTWAPAAAFNASDPTPRVCEA